MLVAIAGGGLQGLEIAYLAKKAGYQTLLLDKMKSAPAVGICDDFAVTDLTNHEALTGALTGAHGSVNLVLPATENAPALQSMVEWCDSNRMPLAFHAGAYAISSSKSASNALFRRLGIPTPTAWPDCAFPVLAKPDRGSGSKDVEVFPDLESLELRFGSLPPPGRILQAFLTGPSYSIEVVGRPGDYTPLQITTLEMDEEFDCKRVLAPSILPSDLADQLEEMAVVLAEAVNLSGIMDVEVIVHEGELKVLEIDARFPSQTPMAVYHSTGINMVERLAQLFSPGGAGGSRSLVHGPMAGSVLEHIRVQDGRLSVGGERIMAEDGPLHLEEDFFGADEALTSYFPEREGWVATLMVKGLDQQDALDRLDLVMREIQTRFGLDAYVDASPPELPGHTP